MADDKEELKKQKAKADDDEPEEEKLDETVPGGRYQVGKEFFNAHGEKIK